MSFEAIVGAGDGGLNEEGDAFAIVGMDGGEVAFDGAALGFFGGDVEQGGGVGVGGEEIFADVPGPGADFVGDLDGAEAGVGFVELEGEAGAGFFRGRGVRGLNFLDFGFAGEGDLGLGIKCGASAE